MSLLPERFATRDWGSVQLGQTSVPVWLLVTAAGAAVWLVLMFVETGSSGGRALWTAAAYVIPLVAICSFTRTLPLLVIVSVLLAGGAMTGVGIIGSNVFEVLESDTDAKSRDFAIPLMEEVLKLVPVALVLWRGRRGRTWSLGASDVLLLGAASGAGFGLVEEAFIRERFGWGSSLPLLPTTEETQTGRLIAGHAVWTTLSAGTLGLGLMLRGRGLVALVLALSGLALAFLDHATNNYVVTYDGSLADFLQGVVFDGYLVFWLALAAFVASIAMDLYAQRLLTVLKAFRPPPAGTTLTDRARAWRYRLDKRAFAYAGFRARTAANDSDRDLAEDEASLIYTAIASGAPDLADLPGPLPGELPEPAAP